MKTRQEMKANMTFNIWLWVVLCVACLVASCDHDAHGDEPGGLSVSLAWADDADQGTVVNDVKLWIFNADDGALIEEKHYGSAQEVASQRFHLAKGRYRVVAVANLIEPFTTSGATDMNQLLLGLSSPSASPDHAYYGVTDITIDKPDACHACKNEMRRVLAELTINIEGVAEGTTIRGKVLNVATGFLPLKKNDDGTFGTTLPAKEECEIPSEAATQGNVLTTETLRLMPTANGWLTTRLFIQLVAQNGTVSSYDIEAPMMKTSGKYQINLKLDEMKPYMYLTSTKIDDWTEGWVYRGEILNPGN